MRTAKIWKNVQLVYGRGSIRKMDLPQGGCHLKGQWKNIVEDGGVMPNPTVEKLYQGCRIAKEGNVDLILAVGGGPAAIMPRLFQSRPVGRRPWKKYYLDFEMWTRIQKSSP